MPLVSFIDESSAKRPFARQEYLVCSAILPESDIDVIRDHLKPLLLPGQIKVHWTDESESRRRKITQAVSEVAQLNAVISHVSEASRKTERFRRKYLEQLYFDLSADGIYNHTLESRTPAQNNEDIKHIVALQGQGYDRKIRICHMRGGEEPLLWIPDIILGAINSSRLGDHRYYRAIEETIFIERKTPDSL